jgi:Cys-rich protein (TIGR01571 family)
VAERFHWIPFLSLSSQILFCFETKMKPTEIYVTEPSTPVVAGEYNQVASGNEQLAQWSVECSGCGNAGSCLYSWACCCCAMGDIRSQLDGSSWCVGCCCMSVPALRWLTRTAYNIEGSAHWDCWTGCFCPCCSINQMLQTVKEKGRAPFPNVGPEFNLNERVGFSQRAGTDICWDAFYALLCSCCAVGLVMQNVGMPCWFGYMCVNPFAATSILRYHNKIRPCGGNENWIDCFIPCVAQCLNSVTYNAAAPAAACCYTFGNLVEENHRVGRTGLYGCDCISCCSYGINYLTTCSCAAPEGRYLAKSVPDLHRM